MPSNSDDRPLERRLAAVERAVGEIDREEPHATEATDATAKTGQTPPDRKSLEHRLETLESRVDELDAALQAVRGFLGGIDAVNEAIESRADAAIAAVDRLERRLDEESRESAAHDQRPNPGEQPVTGTEPDADDPEAQNGRTQMAEVAEETERTLRERLGEQW